MLVSGWFTLSNWRSMKRPKEDLIELLLPSDICEVVLEFISNTYEPEDVYDTSRLGAWAEDNGYIIDPDA